MCGRRSEPVRPPAPHPESILKTIDLRSDTVTLPTDEMRRAMHDAPLGDDVYGEDPTVSRLEETAAGRLGMEAGLLTVSGTMSNLVALLTHCVPGDEAILGSQSHILWYEVGGASALGGLVLRAVDNDGEGGMDLGAVEAAIRGRNIHFPRTALLCLENTHNRCGGAVLTPSHTAAAAGLAHEHGMKVHLDGARIFNAAVALGMAPAELVRDVDSVCFCLSKGLSAPVGSVLCGSRTFIEQARKRRKMVGGGMRQAGVIAAAGIVALEKMVDRLREDHQNARRLAHGLDGIRGLSVAGPNVPSNIVMFRSAPGLSGPELIGALRDRGVLVGPRGPNAFRAVTHRMVSLEDIEEALDRVELAVRSLLG